MSVVPMQKVRLLVHHQDVEEALAVVQKAGALEFQQVALADAQLPNGSFPHAELLPRVQHAVKFLEPYAPKVGLWQTLREGTQVTLTEAEAQKRLHDTDAVSAVVDDLERVQVEFADMNERIRHSTEQHELLRVWHDLPIKLSQLETIRTTTLLLKTSGVLPEEQTLRTVLTNALLERSIPHSMVAISDQHVALTLEKNEKTLQDVKRLLEEKEVEVATPPEGKELPSVEMTAVTAELTKAKGELGLLYDQAEHFAITHFKTLCVTAEILSWQQSRYETLELGMATHYTVVLEGWLHQGKRATIEQQFEKQAVGALFVEIEPEAGEQPPVEIENSPLVQPFEAVTRLYGMPGYKDLDPTAYLAGFFFLFFGLSLTDVGYGLFLMIASTIVLTLLKVSRGIKLFAKLLFFVGVATVAVGALFGGYLGIAVDSLPQVLQNLAYYDPINDPLPVFYLALGLGVLQVMVGMLLKIYSEYRNGRIVTGLVEQGPWFFVFCVAILALATHFGYAAVIAMDTLVNLIYVGVVMVALSGFYRGEGIFGKIISAASSLYDSIGYFSDILSYSRLLALGLATTALAFAVNLIAGMVIDVPYVGYILAGLILLIGHLFNLLVNTLGAFIHSARLQFVEFFGKFIAGTGREFSPLSRKEQHVAITDD